MFTLLMSFLDTARKNVACKKNNKEYSKILKKKCPGNMRKSILVGWEKSKQNKFRKR